MAQHKISSQAEGLPSPDYFTAMAANYANQTGNTTRDVFASAFDDIQAILPMTKNSVIHDNAAGPGTATSVIVDKLEKHGLPQVLISDNTPAMVQGAESSFKAWPTITTHVLDASNLEGIANDHFTHSILNFSIFAVSEPLQALREIHRTLQPGGVASLITWKRFIVADVIHAAQASVRPDLPLMKLPNPQFKEEGVLEKLVLEAGFDASRVKVVKKTLLLKGTGLDYVKKFMLSDLTRSARAGWTEEEENTWPDAIEKALKAEVDAHGGMLFESWVVLAQK